jgi:hypothetical protein
MQQKINDYCLFFASDNTDILSKVAATQLPNQVTGSSDYLTVTGIGLNARYRTPNTAPYKAADTDNAFWKTDASESTCDGNRLIGYDFPRILVKYLNVSPYTILWIAILKPGVTVTNDMRDAFELSIWWDNTLSSHGALKQNRTILGQYVWLSIPGYNVVGWYDSQLMNSITKDSGTNEVSLWKDKLLSGHDLAQVVATKYPIWSVNGILFDGINDFLKTSAFTWVQPCFIYMVMKQITWDGSNYKRIFEGNLTTGGYVFQYSQANQIWQGQGGNINPPLNTLFVLRVLYNGISGKIQKDNDAAQPSDESYLSMGGFTLGARADGTYPSNILVKEVVLVNSLDNESMIYGYLKEKYSL